jgi:hypothetical protein
MPVPSEKELRELLAREEAPNTLDARRIIGRSRARRLPKQVAAGSLGALVLAGVFILGAQVGKFPSPATMTAGEASDSSAPQSESATLKRAPADKVNLCTGTLAELAPSQYGLQLDAEFPVSAPAGTSTVEGMVRLTNTSDRHVTGTTPATPVITLSRDGVVLWHSNGPTILSVVAVDLAPGASVEYEASLRPVRCGVEDDVLEAFRPDLPALEAGEYEISALIDFSADASMGQEITELDLVGGPRSPISLQ